MAQPCRKPGKSGAAASRAQDLAQAQLWRKEPRRIRNLGAVGELAWSDTTVTVSVCFAFTDPLAPNSVSGAEPNGAPEAAGPATEAAGFGAGAETEPAAGAGPDSGL